MKNKLPLQALALALALACAAACRAAGDPAPVEPQAAPAAPVDVQGTNGGAPQAAAVEDEFQKLLGGMGVRFLPAERRLEVAGRVNMQSGAIEVFACAPLGKTHESVVVLDCVPSGLHAGLLALGLEPGQPCGFDPDKGPTPPSGDPVLIEVRWKDAGGVERTARAEDWIWDEHAKAPMPRGSWIFAGSFLQETSADAATFAADQVKSLAVTYHDASSILENPNAEGVDDEVYLANDKVVPPVGTPITAVFRSGK